MATHAAAQSHLLAAQHHRSAADFHELAAKRYELGDHAQAAHYALLAQAQAPREYEIAVNLIVAQQLGIQIPDSLSSRATYVFRPEN